MKKLSIFLLIIWATQGLCGVVTLQERDGQLTLSTNYGITEISEPVLVELIRHPAFERLKHIRQYGVTCHARLEQDYTRYEHCLGVFCITRRYGAPLAEQIAALLHDVSHTVFSHVGDYVFNHRHQKTSYQDEIHDWYLEQSGIAAILHEHSFDYACCASAKKHQRCFEQDLPDLCADRIEYNLNGGLVEGMLTQHAVGDILHYLHFQDDEWFFDEVCHARQFGLVSLALSEQRWGAAWNVFVDSCAAQALKRAVSLGLVSSDDIHFSTDDVIWQRLQMSSDPDITQQIERIKRCQSCYCITHLEESDMYVRGKFSGTDPFIKTHQGLVRLTALDQEYAAEYERIQKVVARGYHIKIIG